jgi:cytochrome c556
MHNSINHIGKNISISLFLFFLILIGSNAHSEQSAESIIKERKALFSKNYKTAKRVQSLSVNGDFDEAKNLIIEMNKNYQILLKLFPDNSKEGFKTGSLPIIWEDKKSFNALMQKSSDDMMKLTSLIESSDDIRETIGKLMWANCKACHSKYRKEH